MNQPPKTTTQTGLEIAVIGMAGRFPGAQNIEQFWHNITNKVESLTFYTDDELSAAGVESELLNRSDYVKGEGGVLEDAEYFDAAFFGYFPTEAEIMDPQIRIFHECAWEALEDAGYAPLSYKGSIGLYAGGTHNMDWEALVMLSGKLESFGAFDTGNLINKDFLCTRVAYKLNLRGPAVEVQSACSTSLTAIHIASRALLTKECDMALAGGTVVRLQQKRGYMYHEGMVLSSDGHCRAFDSKSSGTVSGNGAGVVVLKKLKDAINDRDHIHAIIKGSALNNDGIDKAGFTTPSIEGQANVIKIAQHLAKVEPESIGYIEAHGTGTVIGDPIEIEALKLAFHTDKKHFCAIGSVKTNIGHLDSGAGVAGFIKAVLAVKNGFIPPSLHFDQPNPKIDFENSPFYVNTKLTEWKTDPLPRRAGVSSFGIGGTNAHIIIEENQGLFLKKPPLDLPGMQSPAKTFINYSLICLSAKTSSALERMTENLIEYLKKNLSVNLSDLAYTLQVGREVFEYKKVAVCSDVNEAITALETSDPSRVQTFNTRDRKKSIAFMFPGQGQQYVNMGLDLYRDEPVFRDEMDRCFAILNQFTDYELKSVLYPQEGNNHNNDWIYRQDVTQPMMFVFEYALARLMIHRGITPNAMIGYSIGEYVAACLANVFTLEDALMLVAARGKLMHDIPCGAMLNVPLPESQLKPLLNNDVEIAVVNGPSCIVSGTDAAIDAFEKELKSKKWLTMRLSISHAGHSRMMDPMVPKFEAKVKQVKLNKPTLPYISNVTGTWVTDAQATDPHYWAMQVRETVRFAAGLEELLKEKNAIYIELGPGRNLMTTLQQHPNKRPDHLFLNVLRYPQQKISDVFYMAEKIGRLWLYGQPILWSTFYAGDQRHRIPLPTYPFERQKFHIDRDFSKLSNAKEFTAPVSLKKSNMLEWFYTPSWKRSHFITYRRDEKVIPPDKDDRLTLVFMDDDGIGLQLVKRLEHAGHQVIRIHTGNTETDLVKQDNGSYELKPGIYSGYERLFKALREKGKVPSRIIHLWNSCSDKFNDKFSENERDSNALTRERFDAVQETGVFSLVHIAQAIGRVGFSDDIRITVITNHIQDVTGDEKLLPERSTIIGPINGIPQEYPNIECSCIDIRFPQDHEQMDTLMNRLMMEIDGPSNASQTSRDKIVAFRGNHRWVKVFEPIRMEKNESERSLLKTNGVYWIIGGLGNIGLVLSDYLTRVYQAKLVFTGRSSFPDKADWNQWIDSHGPEDSISQKIVKIQALEQAGAEVLILKAEVSNKQQMSAVVDRIYERFGKLNGVIHSAVGTEHRLRAVDQLSKDAFAEQFQSKVYGLLILEEVLKGRNVDFCLLMSSSASFLCGLGYTAYSSANIFMDTFVNVRNRDQNPGMKWIGVNWEAWKFGDTHLQGALGASIEELALIPEEGVKVFQHICSLQLNENRQVLVSTGDFQARLDRWIQLESVKQGVSLTRKDAASLHPRPELTKPYVPPRDDIETSMADIWQNFFGFREVGIDDDFFELGGDSLKAITVSGEVHKAVNVKIPLQEFFKTPTIRGLREYIRSSREDQYASIEPSEKKEYYPLSSAQKRLYLLQQMDTASVGYNMPFILNVENTIDKSRLEQALKKLIARHDSLRTSFEMIDEAPVQRIHDTVAFEMEYEETGVFSGIQDIPRSFIRPFDLSNAPLLRSQLLHTSDGRNIWLIDLHHIVSDGTSQSILTSDFISLYNGDAMEPLRLQYKDFSEWQNRFFKAGGTQAQEDYWLGLFSSGGEIPRLNLPTDEKRPVVFTYAGDHYVLKIDAEDALKFKALGSRMGATLYMNLLAAMNVLFHHYTGQTDVIIGTVTAGRPHADLKRIIGMFVNTLAMRNYPEGKKTYEAFLKEVGENSIRAFENQDVQFEELVDKLEIERDTSRNPLFDISMVVQNIASAGPASAETKNNDQHVFSGIEYKKPTARFDMTWLVQEVGDTLYINIEYYTAIFKRETIDRMAGHFRNVIRAVSQDPLLCIKDVDILSEDERNRILYEFNDTQVDYPKDKTVLECFEAQVQKIPDHVALIGSTSVGALREAPLQISYRELNEQSNTLASILREKGVEPDTIVAIKIDRTIEMIISILGVMKAGGAYLPIDPSYPQERIDYMLNDSGASVLINTDTFNDFRRGAPACAPDPGKILGQTHGSAPTNLVYIIYTSGSTGKPKGVMIQHGTLMNFIYGMTDRYKNQFGPADRCLCVCNFCFDVSVCELFMPLIAGSTIEILKNQTIFDPVELAKIIITHSITFTYIPPALLSNVAEQLRASRSLLGLNKLLIGVEPITDEVVERYLKLNPELIIVNGYGPTEATIISVAYDYLSREPKQKQIPIGVPLSNIQCLILDNDNRPVPVGIAGELYLSGDCLARGYLNNPELTLKKFPNLSNDKNRTLNKSFWKSRNLFSKRFLAAGGESFKSYKTGDLVRWLADGNIQFLGRIDTQIKIRGFRVELGEIEHAIIAAGKGTIKSALVIDRIDKHGDKYLCAYMVLDQGENVNDEFLRQGMEQIKAILSHMLPEYMIPMHYSVLEKIPLTPNGKVDRRALPDPVLLTTTAYEAPGNDVEKQLVDIWAEILDTPKETIGINDNFFTRGGHSLKAAVLAARVSKEFNINVPLGEIFKNPTIRGIALIMEVVTWAQEPGEHAATMENNDSCLHPEGEAEEMIL
ncbi:MAG: amino acid adenylation domain-containing protein [Candidatus Omnitrophota bacterium]